MSCWSKNARMRGAVRGKVSREPPRSCATLIAERRSALANLGRRITRLERLLPTDLLRRVRDLEAALERSRSPYIQVLVTDIDLDERFAKGWRSLV